MNGILQCTVHCSVDLHILHLMYCSEASERCQAEKRKTINGEKNLIGPNLISHWFLRWGHLVCHVHPWLRQLCRTIETLPPEIQRSYEGLFKKRTNHNMSFAFACFQGERQMEAELSNLGGEVMAGQQLQVWHPPTNSHLPIIDHFCWLDNPLGLIQNLCAFDLTLWFILLISGPYCQRGWRPAHL